MMARDDRLCIAGGIEANLINYSKAGWVTIEAVA